MSGGSTSDTEIALEVLSVTIGSIAEMIADLAAAPPQPPATYASLAERLQRAGSEIATLAASMDVLARDHL